MVVLGILSLGLIGVRNWDSIPSLAWLLVLAGIAEAVHAFHVRKSSAFFLHVVPGIAGLPLGSVRWRCDPGDWLRVLDYIAPTGTVVRRASRRYIADTAWGLR
jgi:uncharacterized membrane protein HdeD (DUF308 family)